MRFSRFKHGYVTLQKSNRKSDSISGTASRFSINAWSSQWLQAESLHHYTSGHVARLWKFESKCNTGQFSMHFYSFMWLGHWSVWFWSAHFSEFLQQFLKSISQQFRIRNSWCLGFNGISFHELVSVPILRSMMMKRLIQCAAKRAKRYFNGQKCHLSAVGRKSLVDMKGSWTYMSLILWLLSWY